LVFGFEERVWGEACVRVKGVEIEGKGKRRSGDELDFWIRWV
jgi:hypothetical protein